MQIMHISAEIAAFLGVIFYINKKNKELTANIQELLKKINTQEETIQNHEIAIQKLINNMNIILTMQQKKVNKREEEVQVSPSPVKVTKKQETHKKQQLAENLVEVPIQSSVQQEVVNSIFSSPSEYDETSSNLDEEIADELLDLTSTTREEVI